MKNTEHSIPTLREALQHPRKYRDMSLALEPMDNFSKTPGGPNETPLSFWASWDLKDRPRRIALLLDDCQEEYRPYAGEILPNLSRMVEAFREARSQSDGVCIVWSAWSRRFDDGISNAMDRWYGPRGLRPDDPENAAYIFTGAAGMEPLSEIASTEEEVADGAKLACLGRPYPRLKSAFRQREPLGCLSGRQAILQHQPGGLFPELHCVSAVRNFFHDDTSSLVYE